MISIYDFVACYGLFVESESIPNSPNPLSTNPLLDYFSLTPLALGIGTSLHDPPITPLSYTTTQKAFLLKLLLQITLCV